MVEELTNREKEVLCLIINGLSTKQIAAELHMAFKTASCHRYRIMGKVGAGNAADLVRITLRAVPVEPLARGVPSHDLAAAIEGNRAGREKLRMRREKLRIELERSRALGRDLEKNKSEFLVQLSLFRQRVAALRRLTSTSRQLTCQ
jgi:DNA-binding CsgD family transcriptional regulator